MLNTFEKAKEIDIETLSIPPFSWPHYFNFPKNECVEIMLTNIMNWLIVSLFDETVLKEVRFCNLDDKS